MAARLTTEQVWHQVAKASFAVIGYVTPAGEPAPAAWSTRPSDGGCTWRSPPTAGRRHVAASGRVAVTVPVRRGGILSLLAPIPPATISFHGAAIVHPAGAPQVGSLLKELGSLIPAERRTSACVIEILPEGAFVTYGLGVPLRKLRDPAAARARVPMPQEPRTR